MLSEPTPPSAPASDPAPAGRPSSSRRRRSGGGVWGQRLLVGALVVAVAYFAREVLVPLVCAGLLALVLSPIVNRLQRLGVGNVLAVGIVASLTFASLAGVGLIVTRQALTLVRSLPEYRDNIIERVRSLRMPGEGALTEAAEIVEDVQREIEGAPPAESAADATGVTPDEVAPWRSLERRVEDAIIALERQFDRDARPIPVEIRPPKPTALELAESLISPIVPPLASFGIVVIFVLFFLLHRKDMKDRFFHLAGRGNVQVTTEAIDEATERISGYLLAHVTLNLIYGIPVAIALYLIGLPGAILWGMTACALRFVPYIGPWTAAILPFVLALAVFDGWREPALVAGTFILLELFSNNVLEPWLYSSRSGISVIAVLLAALFWGWLWGPLGIVLSVPMTVALVVMGRFVPQLAGFTILFGDEASLAPGVRFYNRVLARDVEGAIDLSRTMTTQHGRVGLADEVLLQSNAEERRDRLSGGLSTDRTDDYWGVVEDILTGFALEDETPLASDQEIWCVPIEEDDTDELNARLLFAVLAEHGLRARLVAREELESSAGSPHAVVMLSSYPHDHRGLRRSVLDALRRNDDVQVHVYAGGQPLPARVTSQLERIGVSSIEATFGKLLETLESTSVTAPAAEVAAVALAT